MALTINYVPGMDVYGMIGDPVSHSISPIIHNTLFQLYGISKIMLPIHVRRGEVDKLFAVTDAFNIKGLSCTMPHKQAVIPFCDKVERIAKLTNAVNCVYWREDGIHGTTVDPAGLKRGIEEEGFTYKEQNIFLIGAGAVVKPIALSMAETCHSITITNRTIEKAEEVASFIKANSSCEVRVVKFEPKEMQNAAKQSTLLMNCTCLGMHGIKDDFTDFTFMDSMPKGSLVSDLIYNPIKTNFLKNAEARGFYIQNGLPMVIYQAFEAFKLFTDIMPCKDDFQKIVANIDLH